jgi:hypothetical protein
VSTDSPHRLGDVATQGFGADARQVDVGHLPRGAEEAGLPDQRFDGFGREEGDGAFQKGEDGLLFLPRKEAPHQRLDFRPGEGCQG